MLSLIRPAARSQFQSVTFSLLCLLVQAVLRCGTKHLRRGIAEHEPAAELLDALRQLQRTAADRPLCWALLCAEEAQSPLPRLVHGALTWCTAARLPALQLVTVALGAKGHSKGYALLPRPNCTLDWFWTYPPFREGLGQQGYPGLQGVFGWRKQPSVGLQTLVRCCFPLSTPCRRAAAHAAHSCRVPHIMQCAAQVCTTQLGHQLAPACFR